MKKIKQIRVLRRLWIDKHLVGREINRHSEMLTVSYNQVQ